MKEHYQDIIPVYSTSRRTNGGKIMIHLNDILI